MQEIFGELWAHYQRPDTTVLITTNGTITRAGRCVMGKGCAAQAKARFPGIDAELARQINARGNHMHALEGGLLYSFPVKHQWHEDANLKLIERSARQLFEMATWQPHHLFILPRPGCGSGRLLWEEVRPVIDFLPDNVWVISNGK